MTQPVADIRQIGRDGQKLLEAIQSRLREQDFGKLVAIDVESGEYFLGETGIEATRKAQARHPGTIFFLGRVGCRTAYTFKGYR